MGSKGGRQALRVARYRQRQRNERSAQTTTGKAGHRRFLSFDINQGDCIMTDNPTDVTHGTAAESSEEGKLVAQAVARGFPAGKAPLKIITGTQETSNLSFDLKPAAIVAHPGASVIFVCG
jgi:hypothetical protein